MIAVNKVCRQAKLCRHYHLDNAPLLRLLRLLRHVPMMHACMPMCRRQPGADSYRMVASAQASAMRRSLRILPPLPGVRDS